MDNVHCTVVCVCNSTKKTNTMCLVVRPCLATKTDLLSVCFKICQIIFPSLLRKKEVKKLKVSPFYFYINVTPGDFPVS